MSVEKIKKVTIISDQRKLIETEPVVKNMKVKLPAPKAPNELRNKLQIITELITAESDKLSKETKRKFETFIDKVDDTEKMKKNKNNKTDKRLQLPVPLMSGEKIKQYLADITNLIENENAEEVKKANTFLNKLDGIKMTLDDKRVQLQITPTTLKKDLRRITELTMKASNMLTEKESVEINKFINKLDAKQRYTKTDKSDIKLSQRQELQALTRASEFTKTLKTTTNILFKGLNKLYNQEVDNFIKKVDDIEGTKKKIAALKLAKSRERSLSIKKATSTRTESPEKSVMDKSKENVKDEKQDIDDYYVESHNDLTSTLLYDNLSLWQYNDVTSVNIKDEANKNKNSDDVDDYSYHLDMDIPNIFQEQANDIILGTKIVPKQYGLESHRSQRIKKPMLFRSTFTIVPEMKNKPDFDSGSIKLSTEKINVSIT